MKLQIRIQPLLKLIKAQKSDYSKFVKNRIKEIEANYDKEKLKRIIFDIDIEVPENLIKFRLLDNRKQLIYKIVTSRLEKLFSLA